MQISVCACVCVWCYLLASFLLFCFADQGGQCEKYLFTLHQSNKILLLHRLFLHIQLLRRFSWILFCEFVHFVISCWIKLSFVLDVLISFAEIGWQWKKVGCLVGPNKADLAFIHSNPLDHFPPAHTIVIISVPFPLAVVAIGIWSWLQCGPCLCYAAILMEMWWS